jgi:NAD(P)-dependent dehydrogenase (short-subunit alcohol dehydrogenase family)
VQGLTGRVAVITGAGRGIGRLVARRLADEGAHVALLSRSADKLREAEQLIRDTGAVAFGVVVDVADPEQVTAAFRAVTDELGPPHILVNNAQSWGDPANPRTAAPPSVPIQDVTEAEWDHTLRTGLYGTVYCMRAAYPGMRESAWGRIVNLYSPSASMAMAGNAAYNCTKAAILALSRTAAREWGKDGINVNCVSPIVTDDGMRNRFDRIRDPAARAAAEEKFWGRLAVRANADAQRDVPAAVAYLASEEASFITGTVLSVDGGYTI